MYKHKSTFCALLLCFAVLAAYGQDAAMTVEIKPARTAVNNYEPFQVATAIRNTGAIEQSLKIWSCSYPTQWVSDNPFVKVNLVSCKKNDLLNVNVDPDKGCERTISIRVELSAGDGQLEPVTFRLGFKAATFATGQANLPIWSNPITVTVTK
jgi:hypothetical protein